jgi:hypothetical protein
MRLTAARVRHLALGAAVATSVVAAGSLTVVAPAGAQTVSVGATVDDILMLGVTPATGFATFPRSKGDHVYTLNLSAVVTTTGATADAPDSLSVADGANVPVKQRGHLVTAAKSVLPLPLEVSGPGGSLMSLDQPIAPVVATYSDAVSSSEVSFELSQEVDGTTGLTAGPYSKEVMVTLSADGP